jgi:hypothetical protein
MARNDCLSDRHAAFLSFHLPFVSPSRMGVDEDGAAEPELVDTGIAHVGADGGLDGVSLDGGLGCVHASAQGIRYHAKLVFAWRKWTLAGQPIRAYDANGKLVLLVHLGRNRLTQLARKLAQVLRSRLGIARYGDLQTHEI